MEGFVITDTELVKFESSGDRPTDHVVRALPTST